MELQVGKKYYQKRKLCGAVRRVLALRDGVVEYEVLHGPARKKTPRGSCGLKRFLAWTDGEFEGEDYARLDGARPYRTLLVLNVAGEPLFRCSERRARFYLRKGFAVAVDEEILRLIDDTTEKKLAELYAGQLSPFFLEVKNDHCVVCGKDHDLTRHHIVPQRHKGKLPEATRRQLSNVLFVCRTCHDIYETQQLQSESLDPHVWKDHFVQTMRPKYLPEGWDIILEVAILQGPSKLHHQEE